MDNYRYTFTWNVAGIKKNEQRADVSYAARKFEYQYGSRSMILQISDKKITLSFSSKTLLLPKTIKQLNKDILEKIYVIYTMIYFYGPIMTGSSVLYEKYNTETKKYERTEVADPLPAEALIGFFMVQGPLAETAIPFKENRKADAAYRYLITTYLYKCLRCRFFHGGRPVPLFGKSDDQQIIAFKLACSIVEDMLEKFLFPSIILKDSIATVEEADARLRILTGGDAKKAKTAYNQHLKNIVDTLVESYIPKEEDATGA